MTTNEDSGDQTAAVLAGRLDGLVRRWQKEAEGYQAQVTEAMAKGLPYDQMMSGATFLRLCAKELQKELATNGENHAS